MMPHLLLMMAATTLSCPAATDLATQASRPQPPKGVAGAIASVGDTAVELRQKDGTLVTVPMTKGWTLSYAEMAGADQVQVGQFIGSANNPVDDTHGKARELRVFEPGYQPEYGTHTVNAPNTPSGTMMTHGFVFGAQRSEGGVQLQVAYPGGCRMIELAGDLKVSISVLLERSAAKPGVMVSAVMRPGPDGVYRASRLTLPAKP
jgi:hypothetical protein